MKIPSFALPMVFCISVLSILWLRYIHIDHRQTMQWGYVNSGAINPYYGTHPPLGYRPLMPVLLNRIGYIPAAGEAWLPIISAFTLCLVYVYFLQVYGLPFRESCMGGLLLACSPGMTDLLREFGINHVDTAAHVLILLALTAILLKQHTLFSIATLLGTFNREWALTLIPAWYLYHFGFRVSSASILLLLRVSIPSAVVFWMIRYVYFPYTALGVMTQDTGMTTAVSETSFIAYYWNEWSSGGFSQWMNRVFSTDFYQFGMIGLLPVWIRVWKATDTGWKRLSLYYGLICILQLAVAADVWRLGFYLFPLVLTALVQWLYELRTHYPRKIPMGVLAIIPLALLLMPGSIFFLILVTLLVGMDVWWKRLDYLRDG